MPLYDLKEVQQENRQSAVLNFVDKYSRLIIVLSAVLIIASFAILAQMLILSRKYDKLLGVLNSSSSGKDLEAKKDDFRGTKLYPNYLLKVGQLYYDSGDYNKADDHLGLFRKEYKSHPLKKDVDVVFDSLKRDLKFLERYKDAYIEKFNLTSHPLNQDIQDEGSFAPHVFKYSKIKFELDNDSFEFEIYPQELPKVSSLLTGWFETEDFAKKITFEQTDQSLQVMVADEKSAALNIEKTYRTLDDGAVVFEIVDGKVDTKKLYIVKDAKQFSADKYQLAGKIVSGFSTYKELKKEAVIKKLSVIK